MRFLLTRVSKEARRADDEMRVGTKDAFRAAARPHRKEVDIAVHFAEIPRCDRRNETRLKSGQTPRPSQGTAELSQRPHHRRVEHEGQNTGQAKCRPEANPAPQQRRQDQEHRKGRQHEPEGGLGEGCDRSGIRGVSPQPDKGEDGYERQRQDYRAHGRAALGDLGRRGNYDAGQKSLNDSVEHGEPSGVRSKVPTTVAGAFASDDPTHDVTCLSLFLVERIGRVAERDGEDWPEQPLRHDSGKPRADKNTGDRPA
jgi:hypothetical protein